MASLFRQHMRLDDDDTVSVVPAQSLFREHMRLDDDRRPEKVTSKQLKYDPARTVGFGGQVLASFAPDDEAWKRAMATRLYPNEPPDRAAARIGRTDDGRYYHTDDAGERLELQPPSGFGRLANLGGAIGSILPMATATAGAVVSAPLAATGVGLLGAAGITGTAAAAGEWARQGIGRLALGGEVVPAPNNLKIAGEGILGAAGQGLSGVATNAMTRYAVRDAAHYNALATRELLDRARQAGVRLTPAEATGLDSLIGEQKRLRSSPAAANIMRDFAGERDQEVLRAWNRMLHDVGEAGDPYIVGRNAQRAGADIMGSVTNYRTRVTSPLYERAFDTDPQVNPGPALTWLRSAAEDAKGRSGSQLTRALDTFAARGRDGRVIPGSTDLSLRGLNQTKIALDELNQEAIERGLPTASRGITGATERLRNAMDEVSPEYRAARGRFEELSRDLVEPTEHALGPLLRMQEPQLARAARAVLAPETGRTPELISRARALFMSSNRAAEWNQVVRQFMAEDVATALRTTQAGDMRNVGGKIAGKLDEAAMANLRAALPPDQFARLRDLVDVFRATARAIDNNSDTAFKIEAGARAKREAEGAVGVVARLAEPHNWARMIRDWRAETNLDRQAEALARIFTQGDERAIAQLRALRRLEPDDYRRVALIGQLLTQTGAMGVGAAIE
jgi:hypothetical protein